MPDPQNQFVVENLRPVNPNGTSTATYELSRNSVHPERVIGRDSRGFPIMDTIPTVYWGWFLMPDGCLNKVPLRTGSVYSKEAEAEAYEHYVTKELIEAGCIPAQFCPYSTRYAHLTFGPFVPPQHGETDCGGSAKEGGCEHLQALGKLRREDQAEKMRKFEVEMRKAKEEEILKLRDGIVQGVGAAIAQHVAGNADGASQRKKNLRDGKLEE